MRKTGKTFQAFTEIGWGNPTFVNTEIEYPDGREERRPGVVKLNRVKALYARIWVGKTVYSWGTDRGFTRTPKKRSTFKLVLGVYGETTL